MELRERVVLVTGAARRVGRAIAERLATAGCHVAVHYHRSADAALEVVAACRAQGVLAEAFEADLATVSGPEDLVGTVLARFQRLDVLVNNASSFEKMTLDEFRWDAWERTMRVNLTAPMALAFAARAALRAAQGRIVNLCDVATQRPWPDYLAYIVSKGGLDTLTQVLARSFAPEVNVVGVAPGVAEWPEHYDEALRARLLRRVPLGRAGSPADIAAAVHFLLADGDYITGAILPVDGGRHIR